MAAITGSNITLQNTTNGTDAPPHFPTCCYDYIQTVPVRNLHDLVRFGYPSNFSDVFSGDPQLQSSYIRGVVIVPVILGVLFAVWTLTCCILPCLGQKRVGFWSGAGLIVDSSGNDSGEQLQPSCCAGKAIAERPKRVRIAILVSLAILLIFIIPLVTLGFNNLYTTTDTIYSATEDLQNMLTNYSVSLQNYIDTTKRLKTAYVNAVQGVADFCSINGTEFASFTQHTNVAAFDLVVNQLTSYNDTLYNLNQTNEAVQSVVVRVSESFIYMQFYWIPMLVITCFLLVILCLVWRGYVSDKVLCLQKFVVMPLFCIWVFFSWLLALGFYVGAVVNADACSGTGLDSTVQPSPTGTLLSFINSSVADLTTQQKTSDLARYYFGCDGPFPYYLFPNYGDFYAIISAGRSLLTLVDTGSYQTWNNTVQAAVNYTLNDLQQVCTPEGVQTLVALAAAVRTALVTTAKYIPLLVSIISCEDISPIYNLGVNDAACTYNPTALAWIMVGLLVVSASGMTTITLRSALYPVKVLGGDARCHSKDDLSGNIGEQMAEGNASGSRELRQELQDTNQENVSEGSGGRVDQAMPQVALVQSDASVSREGSVESTPELVAADIGEPEVQETHTAVQ